MKKLFGIAVSLAGVFVFAQSNDTELDPVLRVKEQRVKANMYDLPPIPRGLIEPPPLPPPELHTHDIKKSRPKPGAKKAEKKKKPVTNKSQPKGNTPSKPKSGTQAKANTNKNSGTKSQGSGTTSKVVKTSNTPNVKKATLGVKNIAKK
jgi:hypothetical protein